VPVSEIKLQFANLSERLADRGGEHVGDEEADGSRLLILVGRSKRRSRSRKALIRSAVRRQGTEMSHAVKSSNKSPSGP
jgi:hypothetical protein